MPHADPEVEKIVLGAVLVDQANADQAVALLAPADFSRPAHRVIFAAVARLHAAGHGVDLVTLRAELDREGQVDRAGGVSYIAGLVDGLPRVQGVTSWARLLREHSRRRELRHRLDRIRTRLEEPDIDPDAVLADLRRLDVAGSLDGGVLDRREVARRTWQLVDDEVGGRATGVPTGFPSLDHRLRFSGWRPGQLVYLGARTSRGKSALLLSFGEAAARAGHRVLAFSLEMTPEELGVRRLVAEAGIGLRSVFAWSKGERDRALGKLSQAAHVLDRPFDFAAPSVRSLAAMRAECVRAKAHGGLGLVLVDYLGLIEPGKRDNRSLYERTTEASQGLKALAMDLEVPVLAAVQLNREPAGRDRRGSPRPSLAHFRDSGAIEQDCDVALLIHQEASGGAIEEGRVSLLLAKQRNGWTGAIDLVWNSTCARFEEEEAEAWKS